MIPPSTSSATHPREPTVEPSAHKTPSSTKGLHTLNTLKMSDHDMDTPETGSVHTSSSKMRICAPDKFYGERNKLKAWLLQMDRHFHVEGDRVADDDKVMIATTFMKDQAELWVTPHLERYLDDEITDNENARLMENWDVFKVKLRQAFSPIKGSVIAEKKIQTLRQTHSVADYTALFQQYQAQIEWDDAALIRMYKQGLKSQVREELMRTNARTDTLDELINEAIRLDNDLYELQIEARAYRPEYVPKKKGKQPNHGRNHRQGRYRPQGHGKARIPGHYGSDDYEGMHLDNIERSKPRGDSSAKYHGKGKPDNGKETRTCYNCNKPGHLAAKCRQPKKNTVSRYVNMIETEETGTADDWQIIESDATNDIKDQAFQKYMKDLTQQFRENNLLNETILTQFEELAEADSLASKNKENRPYAQFVKQVNQKTDYVVPWEELSAKEFFEIYDHEMETPDTTVQYLREKGLITNADPLQNEYTADWKLVDIPGLSNEQKEALQEYVKERQDEGTVIRSPSPHPGTRVFTAWDEDRIVETPDSPPYYRDNTDRVFLTPPDSPPLGRKTTSRGQKKRASPSKQRRQKSRQEQTGDAVYVNDKQGVVLYEGDTVRNAREARETMSTPEYENWIETAEREWAISQAEYTKKKSTPTKTPNYALDPRNPTHDKTSWTACTYDTCEVHYSDKCGAAWFPSPKGECRWAVHDCTRHTCQKHLWDKRSSGYFPGINDTQAYANKALVNGRCTNDSWHTCLNPGCNRHAEDKYLYGFDSEDQSFLGLGPEAATRLTRHPSTNSQ